MLFMTQIKYEITKVNKLLEVNNVNEFGITEDDFKYYKNDLIGSIMDNYFYNVSYDDENFKEKLKEFFVYCNDTINDFNKIV
jgi:hypothetical protein